MKRKSPCLSCAEKHPRPEYRWPADALCPNTPLKERFSRGGNLSPKRLHSNPVPAKRALRSPVGEAVRA